MVYLGKKAGFFGIIMVFLLPVVSADLTTDLISYYSFDSDASDDHASNDGTVNGATHEATSFLDGGYSFDGNDDISLPIQPTGITGYTINLWVKPADWTPTSRNYLIANWITGSGSIHSGIALQSAFSAILYEFDEGGSGYRAINYNSGLTDDTWHMVTLVRDTTAGNLYAYVDGTHQGTAALNTYTNSVDMTNNDITVGNRETSSEYYTGELDELGIWARALSSAEIAELYNSGTGLTYPFTIDTNTAPTATINNFINNSHTNDNTTSFNITVVDLEGNNSNCSLMINDTVRATNINIVNNSYSILTSTLLSDGVYEFYINCSDGAKSSNTTLRQFTVDTILPIFTLNSINSSNTTVLVREENVTVWFNDSWEDNYMYSYNHYLYYPNGSVLLNWNETDLLSRKVWTNNSMFFGNKPVGVYTYGVWGTDDHTYGSLHGLTFDVDRKGITFKTNNWEKRIYGGIYNNGEFNFLTTEQVNNFDVNFRVIDTDRGEYKWEMDFLRPGQDVTFGFAFSDVDGLKLRNISIGHFIWRKWYIDFEDLLFTGFPFNYAKIGNYHVIYTNTAYCDVPVGGRCVLDPAIGGLNIVNENYTFNVVANSPPSVNLSYTIDPLYSTSNEVAKLYYEDVNNHTGIINWYWYVQGISVFNDTTINVMNGTDSYSTLSSGNFSDSDEISLTTIVSDGYNSTSVTKNITVTPLTGGTSTTTIIMIRRSCFFC